MFHPPLLHCDVKGCPESATDGVLCSKHFKQNRQHAANNGYFAYGTTLPPLAPGVVSQQAPPPTIGAQHAPVMRAKRTSRFTFKTVPVTAAPSVPSPVPTPISTPNALENIHSHWQYSPHLAPASYPGSPNGHGTQSPQTRRFTPNTPTPPNSAEFITGSPVQQPNQQPTQSFRSGLRPPVVQGSWSNTGSVDIPEIGRRESSPHVHNYRQSQASPALCHTHLANPSHSQPSTSRPPHPQPSHPQPSHPQPSHPQPSHPQPSHPQPSHPQPSHPQPSHPQPSHPQPSHPQSSRPPAQSFPSLAPTAFMKHAIGTNHGSYLTNSHVTNGLHHTNSIASGNTQAIPSINGDSAGSGYHTTSANSTNTNHSARASPTADNQHSSPAPTIRSISTPITPLLAGKALADKFLVEKLVAGKFLSENLVPEKRQSEMTQKTAEHANVASPIATPTLNTAEEASEVEEHIVAAKSTAKADINPEPPVKKQKRFDSDAFDAMIYQRQSKPPTAHKIVNEHLWLPVDPAIHKLHHRTPEWFAAKEKEIETRPRRKVWFGKVGARIHWMLKQERADRADRKVRQAGEKRQRLHARRQDPQPATYNRVGDFGRVKKSGLPEEVREDPAWLAACEWHRKSTATAGKEQRKVQDASVDAWRMYNYLQNGGSLPGDDYNDEAGR